MKQKHCLFMMLITLLMVGCGRIPETLGEVKSEYFTVDDSVKVHYKIWNPAVAPETKTLCFVHGFGCDMNTWEKQFEAFRDEDVRLVFIDLPGYGKSDKPRVDYTFDFFARAIDGVLNSNGIKDAVFVGHSLGTPVCRHTLMTTAHGGALVDVDGVYCFYDGTETPEYVEAIEQFGHAFDGADCREVIEGFVTSLSGKETPQWVTDYAMSVMPETPQYVASSTMQNLVDRKWWPQSQITIPVMVICTQNSGLEPDNKEKMQALYSNLDYTELTTCGHFIHMEQPEMFNEKLKELLGACAQSNVSEANQSNQTIKQSSNMKTLVVYFSATGTTKAAAQRLAKEYNADLYEITPEQPYTAADLDWRDKSSRSTLEMKDKSSRPAIKGRCENIAQYDTVWIGFPVWWYTAPTIVNTFIEAHDLSGKVLNVFATSGGSTVTGSYNDLKKAYPQYTWGESRLMN